MVEFLNGDWEYWLSIDDDNPPIGNPLDLVSRDLDFVGFPTPVWQHGATSVSLHWNIYADRGEGGFAPLPMREDIEEVDAVGTGCFLAARRVFERLKDQQPFVRQWSSTGIAEVGSDLSLSRKIRAAGFKIFCAWRYPCRHYSKIDLYETFGMLQKAAADGRAEALTEKKDALGVLRAISNHDEREFTPDAGAGYRAFDAMAVELETAEVLYALIRAVKPIRIVESGAGQGISTLAMAQAVKENNASRAGAGGEIFAFEPIPELADRARRRLEGYPVTVGGAGDYIDQERCHPDFVFLDSDADRRATEIDFWLRRRGVFLVVHDAYRYKQLNHRGLLLRTPRGLFLEDLR
jgi:predicted O-methyltransferase YrrM